MPYFRKAVSVLFFFLNPENYTQHSVMWVLPECSNFGRQQLLAGSTRTYLAYISQYPPWYWQIPPQLGFAPSDYVQDAVNRTHCQDDSIWYNFFQTAITVAKSDN